MFTDQRISELRSHFPILQAKTYLYSCSQGALSRRRRSRHAGIRGKLADIARRPGTIGWKPTKLCAPQFARFINAEPEEVAIVASASAGINPIANALQFDIAARNKVVMSEYEFPTMGQIWLAQQPRGAEIQFLDGVNNTVPTECYEAAIDERTQDRSADARFLRQRIPIRRAGDHDRSRTRTARWCFWMAIQDCGTRPIDVKALDVDFFVTGTLKYLLGPPGLAFLYVRRELIESLTPTITSWLAQRDAFAFDTKCLDPAPDARRFEGGSPPMPNIYLARPALDLAGRIGMENVAAQIERLTRAF